MTAPFIRTTVPEREDCREEREKGASRERRLRYHETLEGSSFDGLREEEEQGEVENHYMMGEKN